MESTSKSLKCMVVTPEKVVVDETVDFVAVPMFDGELGILADHSPLTGRLGFGELRTSHGGTTHSYYIEGGFVQVNANVVSVLTPKAVAVKDINTAALDSQLSTLTGTALAKAKAQLHVATKTGMGH
ncbi:MAG TPA: ATP synthase F1 subunit epsilon [Gemmatales bacterium]|nr:ATP synthase F1 subunit epsilon [Gemmatales bacterium]